MARLRDEQIGCIPLSKEKAAVLTVILALCIPILGYAIWFPLFGVPRELRPWLSLFAVIVYIFQCTGRVPAGSVYTQLCFGSYTGVYFSAGIYLLPRLPFPILSLFLLLLKEDVSKYLGWVLEGKVSVQSIVTNFFSEGLTCDGIRVRLEGRLVFEVEDPAVYLSQNGNSTNKDSLHEFLQAETSAHIKRFVIAKHSAENLYIGEYDGSGMLTNEVSKSCSFVKRSGLLLESAPVVSIKILDEVIERAFAANKAKALLRNVTNEVADAFNDFYKRCPPGTDINFAMFMFNAGRRSEGLSEVDIHMVKF